MHFFTHTLQIPNVETEKGNQASTSLLDRIMTSEWRSEGPKIVHIETRYVVTDAINFREVVQGLTGKNSSMSWVGNGSSSFVEGSDNNKKGIANDGASAKPEETATTDGVKNSFISSMFLKNISFKDFDGLLSDLPSMEELLCL